MGKPWNELCIRRKWPAIWISTKSSLRLITARVSRDRVRAMASPRPDRRVDRSQAGEALQEARGRVPGSRGLAAREATIPFSTSSGSLKAAIPIFTSSRPAGKCDGLRRWVTLSRTRGPSHRSGNRRIQHAAALFSHRQRRRVWSTLQPGDGSYSDRKSPRPRGIRMTFSGSGRGS